jgi:hypothetical protein
MHFSGFGRLAALAVTASASLLSCTSDAPAPAASSPTSVVKKVGPDGDTIEVAGATVTIPKGALSAPVDITISATDQGAPDGFVSLSKLFKCEPSGTNFAQPVTMKMPFTDDGQPSTMFWSSGGDPTFKDVGGTREGGTMTATVLHFSSGFVGRKK